MQLIDRESLKSKIERRDEFKLVMVLGESAYRAAHIPGSLHFPDLETAMSQLEPADEIIVYCSGETCLASVAAYHLLIARGYQNVRRYAGGLEDWHAAGYPLEGSQVRV